MRRWVKAFLLALCLSQPLTVAAHEDSNARIISLTHDIALNRNDARLFLKRGKLHRMSGHYGDALRDFEWAAQRDPTLIEVDLQRGLTLLEIGLPAHGKLYLDRYLGQKPDDGQAHAARARTSIALGDNLGASAQFARAIAISPNPDYYLERARALAAAGEEHIEEALRGLDSGLRRLGQVVSLQRLAIDLELTRENFDRALARVDRMSDVKRRPDLWLARRGDILMRAGRREAAREAYTQALAAMEKTSPRRRKTKMAIELNSRLRSTLTQLGGGIARFPDR